MRKRIQGERQEIINEEIEFNENESSSHFNLKGLESESNIQLNRCNLNFFDEIKNENKD